MDSPPLLLAKRGRRAHHFVKCTLYGIWVFRNKATFFNVMTAGLSLNLFSVILIGLKFELKVFQVPSFSFVGFGRVLRRRGWTS